MRIHTIGHQSAGPSPNAGWRVEGFRAYADHMSTPEFALGLADLESWAREGPTACMCAEASYRMCHRQLLADALVARGWEVLHIESRGRARPHVLPVFARLGDDGSLTYPGEPELPLGPQEGR